MKRRDVIGRALAGAMACAAGTLATQNSARAQARADGTNGRVEDAAELLLDSVVRRRRPANGTNADIEDDIDAIMAAGSLYGQARAIQELVDRREPNSSLRLAARAFDRQLALAERTVLTTGAPQNVRDRFRRLQAATDDLLRQLGSRSRYYDQRDPAQEDRDGDLDRDRDLDRNRDLDRDRGQDEDRDRDIDRDRDERDQPRTGDDGDQR